MIPGSDRRLLTDARLFKFLQLGLVVLFIGVYFFQTNTGLADNGDFMRMAGWFSSGPIGFKQSWPPAGTPEFDLRFYHYWLPYWKLDFPLKGHYFSSVILLWYPGIVIHPVLFTSPVLYLPIMSVFPKALTLVFLWLTLTFIGKYSKVKTIPALTIAGPLTLLLTTTDVAAYFNSFYQETASLVFLLFVLTSVVYFQPRSGRLGFIFSFSSVLLLATAKISNFYWPFLAFPFLFPLDKTHRNPARLILLLVVFTLLPFGASWYLSGNPYRKLTTSYHSIYDGLLLMSDHPVDLLEKIGLPGSESCIGEDAFTTVGSECFTRLKKELSYTKTLQIMMLEPKLLFTGFQWMAGKMQNLSLPYLGKYAIDDPLVRNERILNFWSKLKYNFFPKGNTLIVVLLVFHLLFIGTLLRAQDLFIRSLAKIGLLTSIACASEIFVALIGDGLREPEKHLFLANIVFDFALICAITIVILLLKPTLDRLSTYKSLPST